MKPNTLERQRLQSELIHRDKRILDPTARVVIALLGPALLDRERHEVPRYDLANVPRTERHLAGFAEGAYPSRLLVHLQHGSIEPQGLHSDGPLVGVSEQDRALAHHVATRGGIGLAAFALALADNSLKIIPRGWFHRSSASVTPRGLTIPQEPLLRQPRLKALRS